MIELVWLTSTTETDPGSGNINFNNASWPAVTLVAISTADRFGSSFAAWLDGLDASSNPVKGSFRVEEISNPASWVEFQINAVLPGSASFRLLDVTFVDQGAALGGGDIVGVSSSRAGDRGDDGTDGIDGDDGAPGFDGVTTALQFTYSTEIADADPGTGQFRFDVLAVTGSAWLYIDTADRFGNDVAAWIGTFDDSENLVYRSLLEFVARDDPGIWIRAKVIGPVDLVTGYARVPIEILQRSTTLPAAGAVMALDTAIAGPPGATGATGPTGPAGPTGADGPPTDPENFKGSSTSLVTIGLGFKVFVTELDRVWQIGQRLRATSIDAAKILEGPCSEYHADTGNLTISVDFAQGAGDHNEWRISITGERGEGGLQGPVGPEGPVGAGMNYDASGTLAERAAFDTQPQGFAFLQTDVTPFVLFIKESATSGDWSPGTPIESPTTLAEIVPDGALQLEQYQSVLATATVDMGAIATNLVELGGTASVSSFGTAAEGVFRLIRINGTPTLVNGVNLILPGGADIACLTNDSLMAVSRGGGVWQVLWFQRASAVGAAVELGDILPIGDLDLADFVDVASALNIDLNAAASNLVRLTGTTTVGGFGTAPAGTWRTVRLAGAIQVNHSAALLLPGGANIAGQANDVFTAVSLGAGNWIVTNWAKASGKPIVAPTAAEITSTATGDVAATNVQAAIAELASEKATVSSVNSALALKADLASPTLTGDPKAPTPTAGDNDTSIATTAFVTTAIAGKANLASPALTGTPTAPTPTAGDNDTSIATTAFVTTAVAGVTAASIGLGNVDNTSDVNKPVSTAQQTALNLKANLASPALTGTPTAPTPTAGDNDTSIATTAFVTAAVAAAATAGIPAGVVAAFGGTSPPTGWLLCYGQNVSRTTYADLFTAIGTTYGVGDGSTTFALPDLRGRVVAGQDDMGGVSANRLTNAATGGLDGDVLGGVGGAETNILTLANLDAHEHNVDVLSTASGGASIRHDHDTTFTESVNTVATGSADRLRKYAGSGGVVIVSGTDAPDHTHTTNPAAVNSGTAGSSTAHNNVQPTIVLNYIICTG